METLKKIESKSKGEIGRNQKNQIKIEKVRFEKSKKNRDFV